MTHTGTLPRTLGAAVLALGLSACQTLPDNVVTQTLNLSTGPASLELRPAPDAREWADAENELLDNRANGYGLVHMPDVEQYLTGLLAKVRAEAGVPHWPGKVYVTAHSGLEAYTQSSGNVYVSIGMLDALESEDELVGLLAHEFAHNYLEYDELRKGLDQADYVADISTTLTMLSKASRQAGVSANSKEGKALEAAAAVMASYQLGRNMLAPAWGRGQEYAADAMAVQLSIRMGYSVPDGLVQVLERQMAYETSLAAQKAAQREIVQQSLEAMRTRSMGQLGNGATKGSDFTQGLLAEVVGNFSYLGKDLSEYLYSTHPDTDKRIARVNELHEKLMAERTWPEPRAQAWSQIKKMPRVQRTFASYKAIVQADAVMASDRQQARSFARRSMVAETRGHARPAMAMWQAGDQSPATLKALQDNMRSPQHRAWRVYTVVAEDQMARNRKSEAACTLDEGFRHFENAPRAWVEYISKQVQFNQLSKAKTLAAECAKRFRSYGPACERAATPQKGGPRTEESSILNFDWFKAWGR